MQERHYWQPQLVQPDDDRRLQSSTPTNMDLALEALEALEGLLRVAPLLDCVLLYLGSARTNIRAIVDEQ